MSPVDDKSKPINLILLTNHFPFGRGEEFLQNEVPFYAGRFDKVVVISKNTSDGMREGTSALTTHPVPAKGAGLEYLVVAMQLLRKFPKVCSVARDELSFIASVNKLSFPVLSKMFHDLLKSLAKSHYIEQVLLKENVQGRVILYSYWLDSTALATLFVNARNVSLVTVSRAHGGDVYSFRHKYDYLSFRRTLIQQLDQIFAISEDANQYLRKFINTKDVAKVTTSRLGTRPGLKKLTKLSRPFHLVSCSYLVPVKRINVLIEALSLTSLQIQWTHIGDGPLRKDLEALASKLLRGNNNIAYEFLGNLSNAEVMRYYHDTPVHLFVNCSETEGIPVTIMEAQSFAIPVVAPEVGGIPEIVSNDTGLLFAPSASPNIIAAYIDQILTMPEDEYAKMREKSFENWFSRYNAEKNFPTFVDKILSIKK